MGTGRALDGDDAPLDPDMAVEQEGCSETPRTSRTVRSYRSLPATALHIDFGEGPSQRELHWVTRQGRLGDLICTWSRTR